MKMFKMIALMSLFLAAAAQSAMAEVGRATSVEDVPADSFLCKETGQIKRHTASADIRPQAAREEQEEQHSTVQKAL
jgi:hypothetical protein